MLFGFPVVPPVERTRHGWQGAGLAAATSGPVQQRLLELKLEAIDRRALTLQHHGPTDQLGAQRRQDRKPFRLLE